MGIPKMAYTIVMARPVVVEGEIWPYPAAEHTVIGT
jgi:hypothetical protein